MVDPGPRHALLSAAFARGAVVLDVRTPEEVRVAACPGAVNVPLQDLPARLDELPRGVPLIVHCAHGVRSVMAIDYLEARGFTDLVDGGSLEEVLEALPAR